MTNCYMHTHSGFIPGEFVSAEIVAHVVVHLPSEWTGASERRNTGHSSVEGNESNGSIAWSIAFASSIHGSHVSLDFSGSWEISMAAHSCCAVSVGATSSLMYGTFADCLLQGIKWH